LHPLIDDHDVAALPGGEKSTPKREAINSSFDPESAPRAPNFTNLDRNANDDPIQARAIAFQNGFKRLGGMR
jgi:hypothetical protein